MDCVKCAAPLPAKSNLCCYCNTLNETDLRILRRPTQHGEAGPRPCPRCREPLRLVRVGAAEQALELDRCDRCFGIFFDLGELETILEDSTRTVEAVDHQRLQNLIDQEKPQEDLQQVQYVPCPCCEKLMNRKAYGARSGVIVDLCRDHGVWLDGGELNRLLKWAHAGGRMHTRQSRRPPVAATAHVAPMHSAIPMGAPSSRERGGLLQQLGIVDILELLLRYL